MITLLKKRLEGIKKIWVEELSRALWATRTSPQWSTNETPFSLVYRNEVVIPTKIIVPTIRLALIEDRNATWRAFKLTLIKEKKDEALRRIIVQKQRVEDYYNKAVRFKVFP